jgi:hypothetical protein
MCKPALHDQGVPLTFLNLLRSSYTACFPSEMTEPSASSVESSAFSSGVQVTVLFLSLFLPVVCLSVFLPVAVSLAPVVIVAFLAAHRTLSS